MFGSFPGRGLILSQDPEEIASPYFGEFLFAVSFLQQLFCDAYHIVAAFNSNDSATAVEVRAYSYVVYSGYFYAMLYVFYQVVDISSCRVTAEISAEDADLDDSSVGLKCP